MWCKESEGMFIETGVLNQEQMSYTRFREVLNRVTLKDVHTEQREDDYIYYNVGAFVSERSVSGTFINTSFSGVTGRVDVEYTTIR